MHSLRDDVDDMEEIYEEMMQRQRLGIATEADARDIACYIKTDSSIVADEDRDSSDHDSDESTENGNCPGSPTTMFEDSDTEDHNDGEDKLNAQTEFPTLAQCTFAKTHQPGFWMPYIKGQAPTPAPKIIAQHLQPEAWVFDTNKQIYILGEDHALECKCQACGVLVKVDGAINPSRKDHTYRLWEFGYHKTRSYSEFGNGRSKLRNEVSQKETEDVKVMAKKEETKVLQENSNDYMIDDQLARTSIFQVIRYRTNKDLEVNNRTSKSMIKTNNDTEEQSTVDYYLPVTNTTKNEAEQLTPFMLYGVHMNDNEEVPHEAEQKIHHYLSDASSIEDVCHFCPTDLAYLGNDWHDKHLHRVECYENATHCRACGDDVSKDIDVDCQTHFERCHENLQPKADINYDDEAGDDTDDSTTTVAGECFMCDISLLQMSEDELTEHFGDCYVQTSTIECPACETFLYDSTICLNIGPHLKACWIAAQSAIATGEESDDDDGYCEDDTKFETLNIKCPMCPRIFAYMSQESIEHHFRLCLSLRNTKRSENPIEHLNVCWDSLDKIIAANMQLEVNFNPTKHELDGNIVALQELELFINYCRDVSDHFPTLYPGYKVISTYTPGVDGALDIDDILPTIRYLFVEHINPKDCCLICCMDLTSIHEDPTDDTLFQHLVNCYEHGSTDDCPVCNTDLTHMSMDIKFMHLDDCRDDLIAQAALQKTASKISVAQCNGAHFKTSVFTNFSPQIPVISVTPPSEEHKYGWNRVGKQDESCLSLRGPRQKAEEHRQKVKARKRAEKKKAKELAHIEEKKAETREKAKHRMETQLDDATTVEKPVGNGADTSGPQKPKKVIVQDIKFTAEVEECAQSECSMPPTTTHALVFKQHVLTAEAKKQLASRSWTCKADTHELPQAGINVVDLNGKYWQDRRSYYASTISFGSFSVADTPTCPQSGVNVVDLNGEYWQERRRYYSSMISFGSF